jgi:hypothetical protein
MAARVEQRAPSPGRGAREVAGPPRGTTSEDHVEPGSGLPEARRSYVVPLAIAIAVFVILIAVRTFWGMMDSPRITAPTPAETEAPTRSPAPSP